MGDLKAGNLRRGVIVVADQLLGSTLAVQIVKNMIHDSSPIPLLSALHF